MSAWNVVHGVGTTVEHSLMSDTVQVVWPGGPTQVTRIQLKDIGVECRRCARAQNNGRGCGIHAYRIVKDL